LQISDGGLIDIDYTYNMVKELEKNNKVSTIKYIYVRILT